MYFRKISPNFSAGRAYHKEFPRVGRSESQGTLQDFTVDLNRRNLTKFQGWPTLISKNFPKFQGRPSTFQKFSNISDYAEPSIKQFPKIFVQAEPNTKKFLAVRRS